MEAHFGTIPVNTHESIVFDTNLSTGIHHTHKLAKKHDFTAISRLDFPAAIFMPPTSEAVEGAYWFGSVRPVVCSQSVCDA